MTHDSGSCCSSGKTHKDPVCGMTVDPQSAKAEVEHLGQVYYFCYVGCAEKFKADPQQYLTQEPKADKSKSTSNSAGKYTCPMHPEVISDKPDDCPLCGMSLESMMPTSDSADSETTDIKKRLLWSTLLTIPLMYLSMSHMGSMDYLRDGWIEFILATPIVLWSAQPLIRRGIHSLKTRTLNMFTLLGLGIVIPYLYSIAMLVSETFHFAQINQSLCFESAAVITTLAWVGQLLEAQARVRSADAVKELIQMMPSEATVVLPDGNPLVMKINEIPVGAEVRIKPGERIPVDGKVLEGTTLVDESMLTGESVPNLKTIGTYVSAGTINGNGSLLVEVTRLGDSTLLAQIINLVSQAQRSRLPVQQMVDKVASIFVPIVLVIAAITFVGWLTTGAEFMQALSRAISVLVVACPCAFGLATPMSIMVAAGRAAKAGVLFKDASSLEALSEVTTLVIDKTGTLTQGKMQLVNTVSTGAFSPDELIAMAAAVESHSEHPLSQAIVAANSTRTSSITQCLDFHNTPGKGVSGKVNEHMIAIGTAEFANANGELPPSDTPAATSVFVSIDGNFEGRLDFADQLRSDATSSITELTKAGLKVILATGDKEEVALANAKAVGISEVHSSLLPADKSTLVKALQAQGTKVAMAGDGINDAPALAQANVGIAMASGTGVSVHSAGIILLNSDVAGIVRARKVSKAMLRNIAENLFIAFSYNILAIPAATGLLLPVIGFALNPMTAAAAMSLSSVSVVLNALRLRNLKL